MATTSPAPLSSVQIEGRAKGPPSITVNCACGCGEPVRAEGRQFRKGHNNRRPITDRFWAKVRLEDGASGCWTWTGHIDAHGYGRLKDGDRCALAHRVSYVMLVGPLASEAVIDHLCRNRRCVRPDHLEPTTPRENILRGVGMGARYAQRTHCGRGHALAGANIRLRQEGTAVARVCLACERSRSAA